MDFFDIFFDNFFYSKNILYICQKFSTKNLIIMHLFSHISVFCKDGSYHLPAWSGIKFVERERERETIIQAFTYARAKKLRTYRRNFRTYVRDFCTRRRNFRIYVRNFCTHLWNFRIYYPAFSYTSPALLYIRPGLPCVRIPSKIENQKYFN